MRRIARLVALIVGSAGLAATACGSSSAVDGAQRAAGKDLNAGTSGAGQSSRGGRAAGGNATTGGTGGVGGSAGRGAGSGGTLSTGGMAGTAGDAGNAGLGATSGGASAGFGAGGGGGSAGGGRAGSSDGGAAAGGTGGVCLCTAVACLPAVDLTIVPESGSGATVIQDLTAVGNGLELTCYTYGGTSCEWTCQSTAFNLSSGDYSVTLSAPGYDSRTVEFSVAPQTNCGCCGCACGNGDQETVSLHPAEAATPAGCCADLQNDAKNCGSCGTVCPLGLCESGKCAPAWGQCLIAQTAFTDCNDYCGSLGERCAASCGVNADEAVESWVNPTQNCFDTTKSPNVGGCADPFQQPSGNDIPQYQCCCGAP
jgi:hypothetical protein